jgi:phosphoglycerate dehydrogenase-like enzyme
MIKIVNWDSVGNIMWGVRLERTLGADWRSKLPPDDPAALPHAPTFEELFADHTVELIECKSLAEIEAHIADANFLNLHKVIVPEEVLLKAKQLRLIQHLGQDYRGIPLDAVRTLAIPAAATPLINYIVVAEHNWAFILNHVKRMPQQRAYMQRRGYVSEGWGAPASLKIGIAADLTLGLCGFGEIARPMACYAQAFGMKALYWDQRRFPDLEARYDIDYASFDELFQRSDIVSVQLPLTPQTEGIIGAREFALMKPGALFITTARGKLVEPTALLNALRERRISAGLDVFYDEPLPVDDPLHALHEDLSYNVTLTSHSAWQGPWTWVRDSLGIWENVLRSLRGEPILYRVDGGAA